MTRCSIVSSSVLYRIIVSALSHHRVIDFYAHAPLRREMASGSEDDTDIYNILEEIGMKERIHVFRENMKNSPGPSDVRECQSLSQSSQLENPQLLPGTSDAVFTDEGSDSEFENAGTPAIFFRKSRQTCLTSTPKPDKNGNKPFLSEVSISSAGSQDCSDGQDLDGDMQIQAAIRASLEIMQKWTMNTLKCEEEGNVKQLVVVHRRHILNSALRALDRASFKLEEPFKVEFPGELGSDFGGPKREFLRCLMKELASTILEGEPYNKSFIHSVPLLEKEMFFKAGRLVVWSILHGGPGIPYLNPTVYQLLIEPKDVVYSIDDVKDLDVRNKIHKLQTADDEELSLSMDWLVEHGVYGIIPPYTEHTRDTMVRQLLKSHVYLRIHAEIAQFSQGLNSLGFYTLMKSNSEEIRGLFLHALSNSMLTMQKLKEIIQINYSEDGSNDKKREEDTMYAFELFLQDCSEDTSEINLNMLLAFWTGADTIPPLGFHKKLEIKFVEDPARLPVAHTCDLLLEISRGETPEEFHRKMELAITCGGEFHLA
ncbi:G2/M phase-specific E3 ubiquitin-protein ligase-like [Saccostrea echinata]|uniref:G2/M phase-specific E3 ubiquitin-protein ligase-like n=1 Tax=Saccostrea echinata TaxID=191078 RepID=UPI002A834C1F|nr:G2/M phase-specific E3 ubiquitin-protein ligase-like [Saccostrea echinata]